MDKINSIFSKIKELGQVNSKREELREHCKLHLGQILKFMPRRILSSDGGKLLECILNGFSDVPQISKNKITVVNLVLEAMRKEATSLTHCSDVISRLCLELPRMPVEQLVKWSGDSVQSIVADNDENMIWRDILPECLNALASHDSITHCGTEMSGVEYKEQCIHTLCQCNWKEKQLMMLAAMFKDIQLSHDDHKQVVNKICSFINDISPDSLPPLLHQLLKLCKTQNVDIVLVHLSHYFNVRLYSKLEPPPQDSESTTMDIDDIVPHSGAELSVCLSTCLYHISQGAAEPELIRKYIRLWPKTQLLRSPFLIDLALTLADKGSDFRTICLDAIKSAIEQRVTDDIRSKESAWVRSVLPPDIDVTSVLKVITTESANHRSLTVVGLISLAFTLLNIRAKPIAPACWSFGKLILIRLCKAQPETASHVLSQLADRILGDNTQPQYADCLYILCKLTGVSVERCTELTTILECCQPSSTDYIHAAQVLDSVHPLINFSTRTRDHLLMVCRKRLYSRDSSHRCLALSGFLTILRHIKLSKTTLSNSQSNSEQYSSHSYLTQLTVDLHATQRGAVVTSRVRNEAMCMEVVSILRRCLMQDATVKQLLYTNLYDSTKDKSVLHECLLELLYEHLTKYLPENDDEVMPLKFDKCVQVTQTNAVLVEPLSRLLYCISQFTQPSEDEDLEDILASQSVETGSACLRSKLLSVLDKMCDSDDFGRIDLDDPGSSDLTPESKAKLLKVQQILQSYEALIAHLIMQWNTTSGNASSVHRLFKAYTQLLDQTKAPPKNKKANKTLNETRDTVKSQKSQKSQKEKSKGPIKVSHLVKDRSGPFKPLPSVWNLRFCLKVMELLYSAEVSWSSLEERNQIRSRRDFHHFVLRAVLSILTDERLDKKLVAAYVIKIGSLLYERFICRFQDMCDFDDQTALGCMEMFKQCLTLALAPKYSLKLEVVMQNITKLTDSTSADCISAITGHLLAALSQIEADSDVEERDPVVKKLYASVVNTAAILLETPVVPSTRYSATIIKLEDYIRCSKQDCIPFIPSILTAGSREQQEAQLMDELLVKLRQVLGKIDEEETSSGGDESTLFPTINETTGHTVLAHICAHLVHRSKAVEHLIARCKCLEPPAYASEAHKQRIERELLDLHKSIVIQLCQLTTWTSSVAKLRCSVGSGSEKVVSSCVRLYCLLTAFMKKLGSEQCVRIRLERLLKISGKKFSSVVDNLIMYLEASQTQENASKLLRDTKLIPRLVLEAEQFSKHVIMLANKAKVNFQQYLSLGTARDFRIKAPILQEVLNTRDHRAEYQEDDEDGEARRLIDIERSRKSINFKEDRDINDAETDIIALEQSDEDENGTPRKKRRVS